MSPVVLYGHETWSLTLREEHRPKVFKNRVLRICGPKRDEMVGGWSKGMIQNFGWKARRKETPWKMQA
jgi:hypothetical protein